MGGDPLFLLLPEILETDSLDWKTEKRALTRGGGRAPDGDWTCQLLHGLQLGWALQAASC